MSIPTVSATSGCSSWSKQFQHGVSQEPPSPTLKGLLQSMEQDEALSNLPVTGKGWPRWFATKMVIYDVYTIDTTRCSECWGHAACCPNSNSSVLVMYQDYPQKIDIIPLSQLSQLSHYSTQNDIKCVCVCPHYPFVFLRSISIWLSCNLSTRCHGNDGRLQGLRFQIRQRTFLSGWWLIIDSAKIVDTKSLNPIP